MEERWNQVDERLRAHSHRMANLEQGQALAVQCLEDEAKRGERHERLLYGNGATGLTTRVHQVEQGMRTLTRIVEGQRRDRREMRLWIAANAVTILTAIAAAVIGLLR